MPKTLPNTLKPFPGRSPTYVQARQCQALFVIPANVETAVGAGVEIGREELMLLLCQV